MRATFDTNVVVSRYISHTGPPGRILALWGRDAFHIVTSEPLLAEHARVLNYDRVRRYHGLSAEQIARDLDDLRELATVVYPQETLDVIKDDPPDNRVLECAVAGDVDYIVSGDKHLRRLERFRGIEIVSPAAFLTLLVRGNGVERS